MKNEETYCDKLLTAILDSNQPAVCAVIDKASDRMSKDIGDLVEKYNSVDYPLLIAAMNVALKGMTGVLSSSGVALVKFFEERIQAVVFTAPKGEK